MCNKSADSEYFRIAKAALPRSNPPGKGITGLEMLIAQAKYAVEIFLDTKIPEEKIDEIYQNMKKKS